MKWIKKLQIRDIEKQIHDIMNHGFTSNNDEDIAYLILASEYASLTTDQPWRSAKDSRTAMKLILNNSFFSYSDKNISRSF